MLKWLVGLASLVFLVGAVGAGYFAYSVVSACPGECIPETSLREVHPEEASIVYDRSGKEFGAFYVENRRNVTLEQIPEHVRQAFLAVEDQRFYQHPGVDIQRIGGAIVSNIRKQRIAEGSSTLTMQLVRNLYPELIPASEKSLRRKALEAYVAWRMEHIFSKGEILEHYLNTIYLGSGAYGVEAAARVYFAKDVGKLSVAEGALLAALPKAPSRLDPYLSAKSASAAKERRDLVLAQMRLVGSLSPEAAAQAQAEPLKLGYGSGAEAREAVSPARGYVLEQVRREMESLFGKDLYGKGLRIFLTIDPEKQQAAEAALETQLRAIEQGKFGRYSGVQRGDSSVSDPQGRPRYLQGALVLLDVRNGSIQALVGGRSYPESPFNRATQARRQPGSAFKPFVFAAALEHGYTPFHSVLDTEISVQTAGGEWWSPRNYGGSEGGAVSLTNALKLSRNRATVRLAQEVGMKGVIEMARRMGVSSEIPDYPSVALGSSEVSVLELTSAYLPIARSDGTRVRPYLVERVVDARGKILYSHSPVVERALKPSTAYALRYMLRQVVDHGTGYPVREAGYKGPAFGKTGTTTSAADLWFVGGTPEYVAGVWVGFDDPREILPGANATGGEFVAPIWANVLKAVAPQNRREDWELPGNLATLAPWLSAPAPAGPSTEEENPDQEPVVLGTPQDTSSRLCVRPRTNEDVGVVSFLVPCSELSKLQKPGPGQ